MREATAGFLLREKDSSVDLLLGLRSTKESWPDIWNGPGGGIEKGETALDCLCREFQEEASVEINPASAWHFATLNSHRPDNHGQMSQHYRVHFYTITEWTGEPKAADGLSEVRWFPIDRLPFPQMMADQQYWLLSALKQPDKGKILVVDAIHDKPGIACRTFKEIRLRFEPRTL